MAAPRRRRKTMAILADAFSERSSDFLLHRLISSYYIYIHIHFNIVCRICFSCAKYQRMHTRAQLGAARVAKSLSNNITKLKNKTAFKIDFASRVRGVVDCKSCLKPRCIYSRFALSRMKPPPSHIIPDNSDYTIPSLTREKIKNIGLW